MKKLITAGLGVAITLFAFSANAALISVGATYNPVVQVDRSSATRSLSIGTAGNILDVNVFVDFTKCDNPIDSATGNCLGSGFSFNGELGLSLTSAAGTIVDLVCNGTNCSPDTYSGSTPGGRVGVLFDDEAATAVGGSSLTSGTFSPEELLSAFDGEDALGSWSLTISDNVGIDPASLNGWRLDITTADVPEPAVISLMAFGLLGMGMVGRRRRA